MDDYCYEKRRKKSDKAKEKVPFSKKHVRMYEALIEKTPKYPTKPKSNNALVIRLIANR